ncbi:hypothetical protein EDF74_2510 [Stenotrophomonas rhizophila]|uniref:DUF6713 family protein n=1 Tax=Stenotrophomonas TaxID=40323 RepID=UPI000FBB36F9|nr:MULTISPECIES: DUF6713 family protein [Stenotrophomonas]ROP76849.1 hypothetical protein EDF74_2510 [Stenotrophomonas rhizophila]
MAALRMERSYFSTLLALILHQIDAAFWREWEMFLLPGGVQGFVVFNLIAVGILLVGYRHVVLQTSKARGYALLCAALGLATFAIHVGFAAFGHRAFHLPLSMAVILTCLVSALWLLRSIRTATRTATR